MGAAKLKRVSYTDLNPKQKEIFNFQKVSSVLADYGFTTIKLSDDWQGADFIAMHLDGSHFYKVQLKGRLTFAKKYHGKDLYICFSYNDEWYLVPHDEALDAIMDYGAIIDTQSWDERGEYSFSQISKNILGLISTYKL